MCILFQKIQIYFIPSEDVHHYYWEFWQLLCYILTLDRAVNQRCTSVNKRKKKRKQVGVMKEYRQVLAAVELVGDRKARVRASSQTKACVPQRPPVEPPQPRCWRSVSMVRRKSCVNIDSHTPQKHWEESVTDIYFYKEACSFVHWSSSLSLCLRLYLYICMWIYNNYSPSF